MSKLQELIEQVKIELEDIQQARETVDELMSKNQAEEESLKERNLTYKHQIEELITYQREVTDKEADLAEREKQILIREKSQINSNRLLDEKLLDFRQKTVELINGQKKLLKEREELQALKKIVDQQALINKKMEETEVLRKTKIKMKEEQVEAELERLKNLSL